MKNNKGVAMIEFALTAFLFFIIIFGIFEFGFMMALKNGNNAGLFYTTRYSSTQQDNFTDIKEIFINKHSEYAFGAIIPDNITIEHYQNFEDRLSENSPRRLFQNQTSQIYVFTVSSPYTYITNFFGLANSTINVPEIRTVYNENF